MKSRPELLDYIAFFEAEPEWLHVDGWYYGARFVTVRGEDKVVATIAPDEAELEIEWWQRDSLRLHFRAVLVIDWEIQSSAQVELMRVAFRDDRMRYCELQLKPYVRVDWEMSW